MVWFLAFFVYPFLYSAFLSFHSFDMLSAPEFTGLANYKRMTGDFLFTNALGVTSYFAFGTTLPIMIFSLAFALFFNQRFPGKRVYLTIFLMACFMGLIPSSMAWKTLLHQEYGLFNHLFIYSLGVEGPVNWLQNPQLAMPAMILVSLSSGIPYYAIYLIGGVASIPDDYYEVGRLEGADFFQRIRYIIIPSIKPIYKFVLVVALINGFQYMGIFFVMTRGGPVDSTRVLSLFIFNNAFDYFRFGYASALTLVLLLILVPVAYVSLRAGGGDR